MIAFWYLELQHHAVGRAVRSLKAKTLIHNGPHFFVRCVIFAGVVPKFTEPSAAKQVAGVIVGTIGSGPSILFTAKVTVVKQSSFPASAMVMV